jgi:1,2-phenylacetyl-CoA epoxidase catalytic subunit
MTGHRRRPLAYLLRMWLSESDSSYEPTSEAAWRVSLENVYTHARHGFATLERAFEFLRRETAGEMEDGDDTH